MKTRGTFNGIWLSNNGLLHKAIPQNLAKLTLAAKLNGFSIILWSNLSKLNNNEINIMESLGVILKDYSLCEKSRFYIYFYHFYQLGMAGDVTALALASDILRMAILDIANDDEYYIYADPNDLDFPYFKDDIQKLDEKFKNNSFGFSFLVMPGRDVVSSASSDNNDLIFTRNDVLIAKKNINPEFFKKYFDAYEYHLKNEYKKYSKPNSNKEAEQFANQITNSTNSNFFLVLPVKPSEVVWARFHNYKNIYTEINAFSYFNYMQIRENSSTWMPDVNSVHTNYPVITVKENSNDKQYLEEVTDQSYLTLALKEKYKLNFKAYVREGYYVDCLLKSNKNDLFVKEMFYKNKIQTHYTFFKGNNHLVIENVNVKQVSEKIHKLIK